MAISHKNIPESERHNPKGFDDQAVGNTVCKKNGSGNLEWSTVDTVNITNSAITTSKIADANITASKIADANITTSKIAGGNVLYSKLAKSMGNATVYSNDTVTIPATTFAWWVLSGGNAEQVYRNSQTSLKNESSNDHTVAWVYFI